MDEREHGTDSESGSGTEPSGSSRPRRMRRRAPRPARLKRGIVHLLRDGASVGLLLDAGGWVGVDALAAALRTFTDDSSVSGDEILALAEDDTNPNRIVVREGRRVRAARPSTKGRRRRRPSAGARNVEPVATPGKPRFDPGEAPKRPRRRAPHSGERKAAARDLRPPDVLYHGTTVEHRGRILAAGKLQRQGRRRVVLCPTEDRAWRVARGQRVGDPCVLYVDARRAHRGGVRFDLRPDGDYLAGAISRRYILNAHEDFRYQLSAGTVLWRGTREHPEVALICVERPSGRTWELPKGKLDSGETALQAALRETREELGLGDAALEIGRSLGKIDYAFQLSRGRPRLKTVRYFLARIEDPHVPLVPRESENIRSADWFELDEALGKVDHDNVRLTLERAARALREPGGDSRYGQRRRRRRRRADRGAAKRATDAGGEHR